MGKRRQVEFSERAKQRSSIYGLLSLVYRGEPNQELLRRFRNPTFLGTLKELGVELNGCLNKRPLGKVADELAVEYTRLFIGPGRHIYPYESAYQDEGAGRSSASTQLKNFIRSFGLEYRANFHGSIDHISIELEFMQRVADAEDAAWRQDGNKKVGEFLTLQKRFIDAHLLSWIPKFTDKVVQEANLPFYREMAKLTKEYILLEAREIKNFSHWR